ncbi:DUF4357 domain-containing protein [Butyrivibrio hungatei]|uniref:Bacteriophage T5 Orf172 DNA-binding domain-containing protein n=1 Tax=Butyrivibrio hungatei TaxID=185008 RepID=A0A1D9P151_9FIRM|nr:DUF4357 domain-containing protein [Butyrivibrio hungatei]AOZ96231.1 hypothetical protein bhn_I1197 [Butyrivibrio hungatei]
MARGVIYVMTSVVNGLIKIGKTQTTQYENRMYNLENNGYKNITGLKRRFAIEVEEYDEKEVLLHNLFEKSRVSGTELFALDVDLVIQLLLAFDGKQIYPKVEELTKEELFVEATGILENKEIPDGVYYYSKKIKRYGNKTVHASMKVKNGTITVLKNSEVCPIEGTGCRPGIIKRRKLANIKNDILRRDEVFSTVSNAACFISGGPSNGWVDWKTESGKTIDSFRKK